MTPRIIGERPRRPPRVLAARRRPGLRRRPGTRRCTRVEAAAGYYLQRNLVLAARRAAQRSRRRPRAIAHLRLRPAGVLVLMRDCRCRVRRSSPLARCWSRRRSSGRGAAPRRRSSNGTIRGRVELRQAPADSAAAPNVGDLAHAARRTIRPIAAAASSISSPRRAPRSTRATSRAPGSISATRRSCRTCSPSSPARPSTFPNNDRTYHNVFSLSKTKPSISAATPSGHSKAVRFDRPGHRPRVLRHPFAHERVHPGVRAPLLRRDRRRRALPASTTCRPAPTPSSPGTRPMPTESRRGRRSPRPAATSS